MNDAGNECNARMDRKMRRPRLLSFADSFVCFWVFSGGMRSESSCCLFRLPSMRRSLILPT
jgi:hypothetical protein